MPSQRKRIGFLPRPDVQKIIDQICINNQLSQSKVTGILVEEALISRGYLNNSIYKKSLLITNNSINKENVKFDSKDIYKNEEIQMINDFIEFKFFKNIMNKNKKK